MVVFDFWTYSCINCLRAIPYVNAWYRHYKDAGLVIIGVHSPEFAFEKDTANVRQAVEKFKISYPVALDSDMALWKAFNNRFWPAHYFVDAQGKIRGHHFGEGKYARSERTIRSLLTEAGVKNLPDPLDDAAGEGVSAASDSANVASPETYLGFERAENFQSPGSFARNGVKDYQLPTHLALNQWAFGGRWKVSGERSALEAAPGRIVYRFRARDLHLVLGPGGHDRSRQAGAIQSAARWQAAGRRSRHGRRRAGSRYGTRATPVPAHPSEGRGRGARVHHRIPRSPRRGVFVHIRLGAQRCVTRTHRAADSFAGLLASPVALAVAACARSTDKAAAPEKPATVVIENFSAAGKSLGKVTVPRIVKTEDEWRAQLPEDSFYVTRHEGTERPFSGEYDDHHANGLYRCICCDTALFDSRTSSTPAPAGPVSGSRSRMRTSARR